MNTRLSLLVLGCLATAATAAEPPHKATPPGVIAMWSGPVVTIPQGWALCDGGNGTPDLRGQFVLGTAAGVNPGATGGALAHTHSGIGHSHPVTATVHDHGIDDFSASTSTSGTHNHTSVGDASSTQRVIRDPNPFANEDSASVDHSHPVPTASAGSHSHTASGQRTATPEGVNTTTSSNPSDLIEESHLPVYYKLAFIMKLL